MSETTRIGAYLRWLDDLQHTPNFRSAKAALAAFQSRCCDCNRFDELFHLWRYVLPPPKKVEAFLIDNPARPPLVEKIVFPSEARAEKVRELAAKYGYEYFEDGVIWQFAYKGDKGEWEYFAKRVCKVVAKHGHANCRQVLQPAVSRKHLRGMFIDVARELKWICPRSQLLAMIGSPTLAFRRRYWLSRYKLAHFGGGLASWFDDELIQTGLAEIATYRDKLQFRRVAGQSFGKKLQTKAIWTKEICRFASRLVVENHVAGTSFLLEQYTQFFRERPADREQWEYDLSLFEVKWPYVLISVEGRTLCMSIWRRSARVDDISLDRLYDDHSRDMKAQIRRINREARKQRTRELHARAIELDKLTHYSRPATDSSSGE